MRNLEPPAHQPGSNPRAGHRATLVHSRSARKESTSLRGGPAGCVAYNFTYSRHKKSSKVAKSYWISVMEAPGVEAGSVGGRQRRRFPVAHRLAAFPASPRAIFLSAV